MSNSIRYRHAIHKSIRNSNEFQSENDKMRVVEQFQSQYLLKVAGSDQYFLQNCQISQYKYIRQCLAKSETPHLMLMSKVMFVTNLTNPEYCSPGARLQLTSQLRLPHAELVTAALHSLQRRQLQDRLLVAGQPQLQAAHSGQ